jgi:hypothetical protein
MFDETTGSHFLAMPFAKMINLAVIAIVFVVLSRFAAPNGTLMFSYPTTPYVCYACETVEIFWPVVIWTIPSA